MRYDCIVVGGGAAGATLAARLATGSERRVLLLEAGPDLRSDGLPAALRDAHGPQPVHDARLQWRGLEARRTARQAPAPYVQGRGTGGGSNVNHMFAVRGAREDFDAWAKQGCTGWSYRDVLPSFRAVEDDLDFPDPAGGGPGPIPISRLPRAAWGAMDLALAEAAEARGHGWAPDHNAPGATGLSPLASNVRDGRRVTPRDACLEPARGRANLHVRGDTLVDRVLLDGERVRGLRAVRGSRAETFRADQVVLCAGALQSPAILMRSGIGPPDVLARLGIRVVLPHEGVGRQLCDHPGLALHAVLAPEMRDTGGGGRLCSCCVRYASGFAEGGPNDLMLFATNFVPDGNPDAGFVFLMLFRAFSRGSVEITSRDPRVPPRVELGMLSDPRDVSRLGAGVRHLLEVAAHPAFSRVASRLFLGTRRLRGSGLADWMAAEAMSIHHPVGSCAMGPPGEARSVVDPDGRVLGVEGLRIADASIFPEIPRANTHLTTIMAAEKLAGAMLRG